MSEDGGESEMKKRILAAVLAAILSGGVSPAAINISSALALQGTPYSKMNCYQFTNAVSHTTACGSAALGSTCLGEFEIVMSKLSTLDVVIYSTADTSRSISAAACGWTVHGSARE